ncbi:hypothetical protein YC2023_098782 [Brassica napus]
MSLVNSSFAKYELKANSPFIRHKFKIDFISLYELRWGGLTVGGEFTSSLKVHQTTKLDSSYHETLHLSSINKELSPYEKGLSNFEEQPATAQLPQERQGQHLSKLFPLQDDAEIHRIR